MIQRFGKTANLCNSLRLTTSAPINCFMLFAKFHGNQFSKGASKGKILGQSSKQSNIIFEIGRLEEILVL